MATGAALGVAAATSRGRGRALDERLFKWVNVRLAHPSLDRFFGAITELGSLWASVGAAAILEAGGRRRAARRALAAAGATWALGQAVKKALGRPRPYDAPAGSRLLIGKPQGTSWPSSHPAVLLTFVTVAGRELDLRSSHRAALEVLVGLVGASRVYLGVHYPADVAGGLLLGRAMADAWSAAGGSRVLRQGRTRGARRV